MNNILMKKELTGEQLNIVQGEMNNKEKSKGVMWVLWLFIGMFGGHRFYLGDIGYAIAMFFFNWMTLGIWLLIDAFFISKRLEKKNAELEKNIIENVKIMTKK